MTSGKALSDLRVQAYLLLGSIYFFTLGFLLEVLFFFFWMLVSYLELWGRILFLLCSLFLFCTLGRGCCHQCGFWREGGKLFSLQRAADGSWWGTSKRWPGEESRINTRILVRGAETGLCQQPSPRECRVQKSKRNFFFFFLTSLLLAEVVLVLIKHSVSICCEGAAFIPQHS